MSGYGLVWVSALGQHMTRLRQILRKSELFIPARAKHDPHFALSKTSENQQGNEQRKESAFRKGPVPHGTGMAIGAAPYADKGKNIIRHWREVNGGGGVRRIERKIEQQRECRAGQVHRQPIDDGISPKCLPEGNLATPEPFQAREHRITIQTARESGFQQPHRQPACEYACKCDLIKSYASLSNCRNNFVQRRNPEQRRPGPQPFNQFWQGSKGLRQFRVGSCFNA